MAWMPQFRVYAVRLVIAGAGTDGLPEDVALSNLHVLGRHTSTISLARRWLLAG